MTTSTILENVSTDELKNLISESVRVEISKLTPTAPEASNSTEQPISQLEAIKFLGKSRQTLIAWRRKGVISAHRLGGRIYYLKSELLEAMK
jgi:hypothetical protein